MTIHETLMQQHPVRKTAAQKQSFRDWFILWAKEQGYEACAESGWMLVKNHNLVVGDPQTARVVITAHYDTPAVMPIPNFITPCNVGVYLVYQLALLLVMLVPSYLAGWLAGRLGAAFMPSYWIGFGVYMALLLLMMAGPANRHNANDNTSGVAAVMELMAALPREERGKAAFILFDNEEKGMLGSSLYAGKHKQVQRETLVINLDCVGVGEKLLCFAPKKTRAREEYALLTDAMEETLFFPTEKSMYPSDQAQFRHGIALCACSKHPRIGWYCSRIHTKKDTLCQQNLLDEAAGGLQRLITRL